MATRLDTLREVFPNAHLAEADAVLEAKPHAAHRITRLDSWTQTPPPDPAHVELTVRICGKGNAESSAVIRDRPLPPRRKGSKPRASNRSEMSTENRERSGRRARRNVRLAAKVMGADRLLTLTSRRYLTALDLLWLTFEEFNRLMTKRFGNRWKYVIVPELHPTNLDHYHAHLAIRGNFPVDAVRLLWRRALRSCIPEAQTDHAPGNIDIDYRGNRPWRINSLARYISKYITKAIDIHQDTNRKRYEKSRGLEPQVVKLFSPIGVTDLDIIRKIQEVTGGVLSRNPRWEVYGGYDCLLVETEESPDTS